MIKCAKISYSASECITDFPWEHVICSENFQETVPGLSVNWLRIPNSKVRVPPPAVDVICRMGGEREREKKCQLPSQRLNKHKPYIQRIKFYKFFPPTPVDIQVEEVHSRFAIHH